MKSLNELIMNSLICFGYITVLEVVELAGCSVDLKVLQNTFESSNMKKHYECLEMLFDL